MKNSVFSLRVIGGLSACLLAFGLIHQSDAETITSDGGRLGVLADDGLRFGTEATPIAGDIFSNRKAKSKKYKHSTKQMKHAKHPKHPKAPKAPKATKQKKQKKSKQKKSKKH